MKWGNRLMKWVALVGILAGLTACSLLSNNDGYQGGDHRGGGPTGVLTGTATAEKTTASESTDNESSDDSVYTGGDHRGGGPTGILSK